MREWAFSKPALLLSAAAHQIEVTWEDAQPVTRAMCMQYHENLDAALRSGAPASVCRTEAARLRSWVASGAIPASGVPWAETIAADLDRRASQG